MALVLWGFDKPGFEELYAVSTGGKPPAEQHLIECWIPLEVKIDATEDGIGKITNERPAVVLRDIELQGYHTFEAKWVRADWVRPSGRVRTAGRLS
jgi:hypothetical protein